MNTTPAIGTIGFTYVPGIVSRGIAYFERWHRDGAGKPVTHTFVVSGPNECIEAHWETGVARAPLSKYLDDPHCEVFFREPKNLTPELGARIQAAAASQLGASYNKKLILALGLADTLLGHYTNRVIGKWGLEILLMLLDAPHRWICSQLVAYALEQQPEFRQRGILRNPLDTIDPQELFEDQELFAPMTSTTVDTSMTPAMTQTVATTTTSAVTTATTLPEPSPQDATLNTNPS